MRPQVCSNSLTACNWVENEAKGVQFSLRNVTNMPGSQEHTIYREMYIYTFAKGWEKKGTNTEESQELQWEIFDLFIRSLQGWKDAFEMT